MRVCIFPEGTLKAGVLYTMHRSVDGRLCRATDPDGNVVYGVMRPDSGPCACSCEHDEVPTWGDPITLDKARRANRLWFWGPQWYWHGWDTLLPLRLGHDEYGRRVLVLGWTFTGRVLIALWASGDDYCCADAFTDAHEWLDHEGTK